MKIIFYVLLSVIMFLVFSYVYLAKPYETFYEVRDGSKPVSIIVKYISVTDDASCTRLYVKESNSGIKTGLAVFPAVPDGVPLPDDGSHAYSDNVFKLTGYTYKLVFNNVITGSEKTKRSERFDIIRWEIIPPYTVWSGREGEDGEPLTEKLSDPLFYEYSVVDPHPEVFKMGNYIDCLSD